MLGFFWVALRTFSNNNILNKILKRGNLYILLKSPIILPLYNLISCATSENIRILSKTVNLSYSLTLNDNEQTVVIKIFKCCVKASF